jgi:hypothetical protein
LWIFFAQCEKFPEKGDLVPSLSNWASRFVRVSGRYSHFFLLKWSLPDQKAGSVFNPERVWVQLGHPRYNLTFEVNQS